MPRAASATRAARPTTRTWPSAAAPTPTSPSHRPARLPATTPAAPALKCSELAALYGGWPLDNGCTPTDDVNICAESDNGLGSFYDDGSIANRCLGGQNTAQGADEITDGWNHATSICRAAGARLCTVAELQADEARCTGCQHDGEQVWTGSTCLLDGGDTGHLTAQGGSHRGAESCPDECTQCQDEWAGRPNRQNNAANPNGLTGADAVKGCTCTPQCWTDDISHAVRCCADEVFPCTPPPPYGEVTATGAFFWATFTGGDPGEGLDLQGEFVYAINVLGPGGMTAGDATFTADTAAGVSFTAQNQIMNWGSRNTLGDSTSDDALEDVLESIRWSGFPSEVTYDLANIEPGTSYRLQMLFAEKCCSRGYDVFVEGEQIVDDFSPQAVQGGINVLDNGAALTMDFTASDDVLNIELSGDASFSDRNPILDAITLESARAASSAPRSTSSARSACSTPTPSAPSTRARASRPASRTPAPSPRTTSAAAAAPAPTVSASAAPPARALSAGAASPTAPSTATPTATGAAARARTPTPRPLGGRSTSASLPPSRRSRSTTAPTAARTACPPPRSSSRSPTTSPRAPAAAT